MKTTIVYRGKPPVKKSMLSTGGDLTRRLSVYASFCEGGLNVTVRTSKFLGL